MRVTQTLSLAALVAVGSAHTTFLQLIVEGTTYPIGYGIPVPNYDGPVTDVTQQYLACNGGSGPNPTTPSPNIINVKAGDTVQAVWRHTLQSTPANDAVYVVDPSHKGPTLAYLKQANNGSTDGPGGGWFKIQEAGLNVATQGWAVTDLIANGGYHSIKIPTCIPNGRYLLRAELIALHAAGSPQGAQLYMECAQINVSGATGAANPPTVSLPGAYAATDPGLLINIYQSLSTYHIPGPTPFVCGGTQPSSTAPASTLATSVKSSTTSKAASMSTSTSAKVSTTTSSKAATSSSAGAPLYGQCGGTGWTGPTTCASGTCTVSSAYYSQCLP